MIIIRLHRKRTLPTSWFCAGHKKLSVIGLMATGFFRSTVANKCGGHAGAATAVAKASDAARLSYSGARKGEFLQVAHRA
jgi:hypothetical protein